MTAPMTGIDRLSASSPLAAADARSSSAQATAAETIGAIGHRVLAWVQASGGSAAGASAWSQRAGGADGFVADPAVLAQRGDVYGLNQIAGDIARQHNATPTQEGDLRRGLESFTRAAMVQVAGLSGAAGDRQVAGLGAALDAASAAPAGEGIDGVIQRLDAATASLSHGLGA